MRKTIAVAGLCALAALAAGVGTKVFGPLVVLTDQTGSTAPEIRFMGANGKYLGWRGVTAPGSICSWALPAADGTAGQVLTTDGNCTTSWTAAAAGGAVSSIFGRTGAVVAANGDYSFGQLSGGIAVSQMNGGTGASSSTVWWGDGTWRSPAGGAVASVFGRTGAVTAASNDYSFGQLSGNIAVSQMNSGTGASSSTAWFGDGTWKTLGAGTGTVTSVGLTVPPWLSITGSPVTIAGTLVVGAATGQTANYFLAAPNGSSGALSPRAIVQADLPCTGTHLNIVTGSRAIGAAAIYTNATGCPLDVIVTGFATTSTAGFAAYVSATNPPPAYIAIQSLAGVTVPTGVLAFRVPPGQYYQVQATYGTVTLMVWTECY